MKLLKALFIIILILGILVGAGAIFLKIKFDIGAFSLVSQVVNVKKEVNETELVTKPFTSSDLTSFNDKKASIATNYLVRLKDTEIAAYADSKLDKNQFEFFQIELKEIEFTEDKEHSGDVKIVLKISLEDFKKNQLNDFPKNMLKMLVPDVVYATIVIAVDIVDNVGTYKSHELVVNNGVKYSELFKVLNLFTGSDTKQMLFDGADEALNQIFGSDGALKELIDDHVAMGYSFNFMGDYNCITLYRVDPNAQEIITYVGAKGDNINVTTYKISDNYITLQPVNADGYNFLGWYTDPLYVHKIEGIDPANFVPYILYAKYELIEYSIQLDFNGGTSTDNSLIKYTIESADINIKNPTKTVGAKELEFNGWMGTGLESLTKNLVIPHGSFGDKSYKAYYLGEEVEVSVVLDDKLIGSKMYQVGNTIDKNSLLDDYLVGYSVDKWYVGEEEFDFSTPIEDNITLKGSSTYLIDCIYFYPYLNEFNQAVTDKKINIDSREELIAFLDYIIFYEVTEKVNMTLTYIENSSSKVETEVKAAKDAYEELDHYQYLSHTYYLGSGMEAGKVYYQYYLSDKYSTDYATQKADPLKSSILTQQDYALKLTNDTKRANDFDDFKINKVNKKIAVTNSNQLVWALENGYNVEASGRALEILNKIKAVMRDIVNDEMDDLTKLRMIYEWIILNTSYDQKGYLESTNGTITVSNIKYYDSWFLEGVFDSHVAVCEGYAKAFNVMAALENIPAIYITGDNIESEGAGHAWNKVYLDSKWYGIDATHGDVSVTGDHSEILSYDSFLFTDSYKLSRKYQYNNFKDIKANTKFDFALIKYNNHSFKIDSYVDLKNIIDDTKDFTKTTAKYTCSIFVPLEHKADFESIAWKSALGACSYTTTLDENGNVFYNLIYE